MLSAIRLLVFTLTTLLSGAVAFAGDAGADATKSSTKASAKSSKKKATTRATAKAAPATSGAAAAPTAAAATATSEKSLPPPSSSPMAELKKSNAALDKVLQKNRPNWSPEAELQRAEVQKVVGNFLDYGELARRALARHWETITPKQRDEFVKTLKELVERSYLKQVHGGANYTIKYEKEQKTGSEATVIATLHTTSRGKKVNVALEYRMLWKDAHWVVYDVLTDDQSMLENYRAEFNKIITKESFDALLKRMKKKLEEKQGE